MGGFKLAKTHKETTKHEKTAGCELSNTGLHEINPCLSII